MAGNSGDTARSVLGRALAVLGSFSDERPEQTLGMIAAATGLPSATAHRLVAELVEWGALERPARGRYRIGIRLWQLGALAPVARDLRDTALPFLQDLVAVTGQIVHLVVLDGYEALFVERLTGHAAVRVRSRVGRALPLHASGPGKVLLAHALAAFVDEVLTQGLPRLATGTITDPGRLTEALAGIRRSGFCLSRDEMTDGASSVAAPITGPSGDVVASLSVVVPSSTENLQLLVPAVRVTAAGVSRALHPRSPLGERRP
ncbi:IclR family transcriptional regulator [Pseudonocardia nigra]|uniref:IclR family transcriptional regulator n=1 Tax=Pseudonocardia nigra TaxID=1921578 RepID=UPI001C5F9F13|nr:IclR family transcriptional regulator [Pseudonocardia nigra]